MKLTYLLVALVAAFGLTQTVNASPVTFTHQYGTDVGHVAPLYGSGGTMNPDSVSVLDRNDTSGNRFFDVIDFGSAGLDPIESLTLTLKFANARDGLYLGFIREDWRVYGSTNGGTTPADRVQLGTRLDGNAWTYTLESGSVFDQAVATGAFSFWFGDEAAGPNDFQLYSASVTVAGVAPIPLPAAGFLLLGAIGGLAFMRRNGSKDAAL